MIDLHTSRLFTPFTHSESGLTFHILTEKIAPLQKGFYFVNDSMSADGRYLWFCCAHPPALVRTLAVVDLQTQEIRHFPETQFSGESPYIDAATGHVYWCVGNGIWQRGPGQNDTAQLVNELAPQAARGYG
ncbi:MAG: hypothetical protein LC725_05555, partial [Lentisphaerae bacterium]|nr:hypothetical protein [Lentisphaerota bacterium]